MKGRQQSLGSYKMVQSVYWKNNKKIDDSFCPLSENVHVALIPMVSSNHQQVPVCFSGTEWKEVESTYKQKHNERNEGQLSELRKLQDGARYVMKE